MTDPLLSRLDARSFQEIARLVLDTPTFDWIRSGSGAEFGGDNEAAFGRRRLRPSVLVDVSTVSTATTLLGAPVTAPVMIGPMGMQQAVHPDGELAMAEGAARAGSLLVVAVNATTSIDAIAAAQPDLPLWFQLYNWDDLDALAGVIARAEAAGCKAIVPLVNTPLGVNHSSSQIGFRLPAGARFAHFESSPGLLATNTWDYIGWLRSVTSLPIVPKGIMTGDDAARAVEAGAAGLIVSNHGGRQLSRSISTLDALVDVVPRAGGVEVYLDGGVRTGGDVLIALALGARAVMVGRPVMWGMAIGGADGVARVLDDLRVGLAEDAGMCGIADVTAVPRDLVVDAPG
ncbi:MAG: alpha-hydroxy-acid oxidizing protein [Chloroflexi bacterium]|nr:alpha-hydroxy-acid oxidizing protein [Chloroflexota bacterium]